MSDILIKIIQEAIVSKEAELDVLRRELKERESTLGKKKTKRTRKETGLQKDGVPFLIREVLRESPKPLGSADISERLKKKGKELDSRFVMASIHRYVSTGRIFEQTSEGLYTLKKGE
jgi:hypothetical protein